MRILSAIVMTLVLCVATLAIVADRQDTTKPATQTCTLKISGMTCAGCEAAVRIAARSVEGVTDVTASYAETNAEVTYDPSKTNPDAIAKVITDRSGFKAERVQDTRTK